MSSTFVLTYNNLIPMSLYVALEITKMALSALVKIDPEMMYREMDNRPAEPRNSDLLEEMGQIEILFSDKTGTLTRNKMDFVRASVA